jgi:hypothetical protein
MTTVPEPLSLRSELHDLLRESNPRRTLDSLETVVVLAYLRNRQLAPAAFVGQRPTTIEGWLEWVARHSADS